MSSAGIQEEFGVGADKDNERDVYHVNFPRRDPSDDEEVEKMIFHDVNLNLWIFGRIQLNHENFILKG